MSAPPFSGKGGLIRSRGGQIPRFARAQREGPPVAKGGGVPAGRSGRAPGRSTRAGRQLYECQGYHHRVKA